MAALPDAALTRVVDLRQIRAFDLEDVLREEIASWDRRLNWDFTPSADLVRRFVDMQALAGYALLQGSAVIGYTYYVCEERKGLIGDLYVREAERSVENENLLLRPVLDTLFAAPFVKRVESQLMMVGKPFGRPLPMPRRAHVFERDFMEAALDRVAGLAARALPDIRFEPWAERHQDRAAHVIADAYKGHIDSSINDQYRSSTGARRFLLNIVQYPGCGTFFQPASFAAFERESGRMVGICLSSLVRSDAGHITQICVTPPVRGTGTGYELMRRALVSLHAHGCKRTSLTVTSANTQAVALYRKLGFSKSRDFAAYVWDIG